jgi:low molecular weight phosphotyrosine protein phosphatase
MRVLMVCLGNICRSPMAEAVLAHQLAARSDGGRWLVDSAGTGAWHVGERPHHRTRTVLDRHGVAWRHRARQVEAGDFTRFDLILAMDRANHADLGGFQPTDGTARVALLGDYDPEGVAEVPDPYYSEGLGMFEQVYRQCVRCCQGLLAAHPPA